MRKLTDIIHLMKSSAPSLLPILRSQAQAELLTHLMVNPESEVSVSELAESLGLPAPTVSREVSRAERAGVLASRRIGRTKLVRADTSSPYFAPLRDLLVMAFGPPALIAEALRGIRGIESAWLYGSWAARWSGREGDRPVGDIDLLVLGKVNQGSVYDALGPIDRRLHREIQVTFRPANWLEDGEGSFHDTVISRPLVRVL